jgi:hypothetical protein
MADRAILSIDGNCGCALLGTNLQEGEAEFVEIECSEPKWTVAWEEAATKACLIALRRLRARFPERHISYAWDRHPLYDK